MMNLLNTFQQRSDDLIQALIEHMQLSFLSLFIAVALAVPLGIFLMERKRLAEPIIQVTAIFQTIPSLALLGLLIPFVGIGTIPAITALTVYALLPILRNTYTGLTEIDPALNEAADAMGMNRWRKLRKVQLPIAMPVIMAGIRTAMVLIIGTATVAALIGAGGLGSLILLGIDRANHSLILLGAIPATLLAIAFDWLLRFFQTAKLKHTLSILITGGVIMIGFIITPFFFSTREDLVISGKLGAEPEILMNMYALLIEEETDLTTRVEPNFGRTQFVFEALESGEVDIVTEYTGTVMATFFDEIPEADDTPEDVYAEAAERVQETYDMHLFPTLGFNNTYTLAVEPTYAEEYQLETISDLHDVSHDIQVGFTLEFADREDGYLGIQEQYGLEFPNLQTMDPQLRYTAMQQGDIQLVDAYSTDSDLEEHDLVVLEDDQGLFPPYQGAPLTRLDVLKDHPELESIFASLEGLIDDEAMREMNYAVDYEDQHAEEVAREFLVNEGLLEQ